MKPRPLIARILYLAPVIGCALVGMLAGGAHAFLDHPMWCHKNGWSHEDEEDHGDCYFCKGMGGGPKCDVTSTGTGDSTRGQKDCLTRTFTYEGEFANRACYTEGDQCDDNDDEGSGGQGGGSGSGD